MKHASLPCACLALLLASPLAAQTTKSFRISGVVVNSLNGAPVQHCHLTAAPAGSLRAPMRTPGRPRFQGENLNTDTDSEGRFSLSIPGAGAWALRANAPGYAMQAYEEHEGYSTAIVLTEQAPAMELRFRLLPEANVTGTVLDEAGEAVRGAHVFLFRVPRPGPDGKPLPMTMRSSAMTDDRGFYEFVDLSEGDYKILVQARPWYAASAQMNRGVAQAINTTGPSGSALDPSLDVAYPLTWYPGGGDAAAAETLALHPGDHTQADFQLSPVAAVHIQVLVPTDTSQGEGGRAPMRLPMVQQVVPGIPQGTAALYTMVSGQRGAQGQQDVGGLAPGTYIVRLPGAGRAGESRLATVEVTAGGTRTLDLNSPSSDANVTIHIDGDASDNDDRIQVTFTNAETEERLFSANEHFGPGPVDDPPPGRGARPGGRSRERTMQVPPGRYEVTLAAQPDFYLAGMTAQSAETTGRYVKIIGGNVTLTLHVARGKASVSGFVKSDDHPVPGAMVMLVPAGLADPKSMTGLARDQTNTDGSFNLPQVLPGQYILLAIDHGWQINWKNPSTLNRYLVHGVPLDLRPGVEVKQDVGAQAP